MRRDRVGGGGSWKAPLPPFGDSFFVLELWVSFVMTGDTGDAGAYGEVVGEPCAAFLVAVLLSQPPTRAGGGSEKTIS